MKNEEVRENELLQNIPSYLSLSHLLNSSQDKTTVRILKFTNNKPKKIKFNVKTLKELILTDD
jgi:hypothetical protein